MTIPMPVGPGTGTPAGPTSDGHQERPTSVLIIGSGHLTHNLRDWARGQGAPAPYAREFQEWVKEKLEKRDVYSLMDYRSLSPQGARAHPTDEHFLPFFFALGAAPVDAKPERVVCDYIAGMTDNFILREYERVRGESSTLAG